MRFGSNTVGVVAGSSTLSTYRCDWNALNAPAGVAVELRGSASKTIKVLAFFIAKPNVLVTVKAIKAAASTGGASTAGTIVPLDSTNAAATATVLLYTGAPPAGAPVGNVWQSPVNGGDTFWEEAGHRVGQPIVLRGAAEALQISLSVAVNPLYGYFEWVEV